jgi:anti-anti-sigma factor
VEIDVGITRLPTTSLVTVVGEVDLATSPRLHEVLEGLDADQAVVVDLTGVSFLDSSGLSELVQAHERHAAAGGVRLVVTSAGIRRVLEVSGLDEVFAVFDSPDDALGG